MTRAVALLLAALLVGACAEKPVNATPEGAVRELTERLKRSAVDTASAKIAFGLLSKATQANLIERAERYAKASGKPIAPADMIAPSSYLERFEVHELTSKIVGAHALVHAEGLLPGETADIPCVFEDGGWRVEITLPPGSPASPASARPPASSPRPDASHE